MEKDLSKSRLYQAKSIITTNQLSMEDASLMEIILIAQKGMSLSRAVNQVSAMLERVSQS
jgi:hypothetical protein